MRLSITTAEVIAQQNSASQAQVTEIVNEAADNNKGLNEEIESNCPTFDMFYNDGGSASI